MGALPTLRAATDPSVLGGQYYGPDGLGEARGYPRLVASSAESYDVAVQQRLWAVSEDLTGVRFPVERGSRRGVTVPRVGGWPRDSVSRGRPR